MSKLYDLTSEYLAIQHRLEELDDAPADVDGGEEAPQVVDETTQREELYAELDRLSDGIAHKVENIAKLIKHNELRIESLEGAKKFASGEVERLRRRAQAIESRNEWLRHYLRLCLKKAGMQKVRGEHLSVSLGAASERVEVEDPSKAYEWPQEIWDAGVVVEEVRVNKSLLKQMFKNVIAKLPGVAVVRGDERLTIR